MKERRSASSNLNPVGNRKRNGGGGAAKMMEALNKPLPKPPVMYSERDNNRDTFLLKRADSKEDGKIHVHSGAASQLFDAPPPIQKPKPTVNSLREKQS